MNNVQPQKLVFNPQFKPLSMTDGDEIYPNGLFKFNITKMLDFIKSKPEQFPIEDTLISDVRTYVSSKLDEKTIKAADITNPIIVTEISPHRFNVIDGNHRLEKAYRENHTTIPAYRISAHDHVAFLTASEAYKIYVNYWNEKVDESDNDFAH